MKRHGRCGVADQQERESKGEGQATQRQTNRQVKELTS